MRFFLKQHLSESWLKYVQFHSEIITYAAGEKIIKQNEPVKGLYFINNGKVKVVKEKNGQEFILRFASDNDVLGHRGLDESKCYCISATCYTDTEVTFIPLDILTQVLKSNAEFTYRFLMFFASELRHLEDRILAMQVPARIAEALLLNFEVFGEKKAKSGELNFTIPRKDIAAYAQTTYESVIRTLQSFKKQGIIALNGKNITIKDLGKLKTIAQNGQKN